MVGGRATAFTGPGNALDNIIVGGAGVNTLTGGAGNDILTGGAASDLFVYTAGSGTTRSRISPRLELLMM
ncbi:hypothetical protein [Neorhizobium sp. T25_13]|uniref:hypothetical protein n=1 Tax=Neorhizobium sp. T25_13 TaxID=2093830 RepID=UPI001FE20373